MTLTTHLEDRPPQRILMDVGGMEESEYTHVGHTHFIGRAIYVRVATSALLVIDGLGSV